MYVWRKFTRLFNYMAVSVNILLFIVMRIIKKNWFFAGEDRRNLIKLVTINERTKKRKREHARMFT